MIKNLVPIKKKDSRTYDFHRTFGAISPEVIPQEFNFDQTGVFPDQNADGLPEACTAYATTGMASNNDKTNYDDKNFTYTKTKLIMGVEGDVPCDQMTALKSATVYGVRKKGQGDADALGQRQAPFFIVKKLNGSYFDGLLSAMWVKQGTLSIGTDWPPEAEVVGSNGVVPPFTVPAQWSEGHNWEVCGVKMVDGQACIIAKSWQGSNYGDKGYCYFTRKQTEDLVGATGSGAFGQKHLEPRQEIQTVKLTTIEFLISLYRQLVVKLWG